MSHIISTFRTLRIPQLALFLCLLVTGCSSFNRDWKAAATAPAPKDGLEGRWEGTWTSDASGHKNELRCLMTKTGDGKYDARYRAKYKKGIFTVTFGYTAPLTVTKDGDVFKFTGEADLGWYAGGLYHYEGHASTNFFSTYSCKYDHGTFNLTRPAANP